MLALTCKSAVPETRYPLSLEGSSRATFFPAALIPHNRMPNVYSQAGATMRWESRLCEILTSILTGVERAQDTNDDDGGLFLSDAESSRRRQCGISSTTYAAKCHHNNDATTTAAAVAVINAVAPADLCYPNNW